MTWKIGIKRCVRFYVVAGSFVAYGAMMAHPHTYYWPWMLGLLILGVTVYMRWCERRD